MFVVVGLGGIAAGFFVLFFYMGWRSERLETLESGSQVVQTDLGALEYSDSGGDGPVVVVLHGGAGGYDQGEVIARPLKEVGFRVLSLSRPGYLRTPLASGPLPEQQADLVAVLLLEKGISRAGVLGFGEGAAVAVAASLRHPDRLSRLALLSPIVLRTEARPKEGTFLLPAEAVLQHLTGDMGSWLLVTLARFSPMRAVQGFLSATTNLGESDVWRVSSGVVADPGQLAWFRGAVLSFSPQSPRETGTRNDLVQLRALPGWDFGKIRHPVLVLRGANDAISPVKDFEALKEKCPEVSHLELADSGFLVPGMGPDAAAAEKALVEFFQEP